MCYRGPVVDGRIVCPRCEEENPLDRATCQSCGEPLVPEFIMFMLRSQNPDTPDDDLRLPR